MSKKITVELTADQHKRFVNAKLDRNEKSLQSLLINATEAALSIPNDLSRPRNDERKVLAPEATLGLLSVLAPLDPPLSPEEWSPGLQAAVGRIIEIWRAGDSNLIEWITGNLHVFAGAARSIKKVQDGHGVDVSLDSKAKPNYAARVEQLLEDAGVNTTGLRPDPKQIKQTGTSGGRVVPLAKRHKQPTEGRGQH